jgi:nicotinamidase/pyrazinamidase
MNMPASSALLLIDVQNDFCPGGALAVPRGDRVLAPLNRVAARFAALRRPIFASRDWHPAKSKHFADFGGLWPVHCVQGTTGAEFHPDLQLPPGTVILSKGDDPKRDDYSAVTAHDPAGTSLVTLLREAAVTRVCVGGLATDYCVKATVLDLRSAGFAVTLLVNAIAGVELTPGDSDAALNAMRAAGARFSHSEEIG